MEGNQRGSDGGLVSLKRKEDLLTIMLLNNEASYLQRQELPFPGVCKYRTHVRDEDSG